MARGKGGRPFKASSIRAAISKYVTSAQFQLVCSKSQPDKDEDDFFQSGLLQMLRDAPTAQAAQRLCEEDRVLSDAGFRADLAVFRHAVRNAANNQRIRFRDKPRSFQFAVNEDGEEVVPGDTADGPLAGAENKECILLVREALSKLSPGYRAVIYLRYYEGLAYREIGERLGRIESSVRTDEFRARAQLRQVLQSIAPA
ncbi:MAG TPA: RNA polymerase sigma factor [Polyangiaceae bacterium]|nr:RNA polymerase sigma factor [Polyangiaceae bacterium]